MEVWMAQRDPNQKQVRYAVVGLGHISQVAMLPAFEHARENSKLTALVSSDQKKRDELGKRYGVRDTYGYDQYQACLASGEVDAVYIALPNDKHREYAVSAAEAGVHVLCEKPLAPNEADCEAMIAAAAQNGVQLMTAYRLHFDEGTLSTMELVRSGKLGASRIFDSVFTLNITDQSNIRLSPPERGGGSVFDLGVYCINAARHYFASEPYEVIASSANCGEPRFAQCDESTTAILRFPGQRLATFTTSFGAADTSAYRLVCSDGWVQFDPGYEYAKPLERTMLIDGKVEQKSFGKHDQFAPQLVHFSNCVLDDEEPGPSGWEGLADVRVVRAIHESARTGRPVELAPFTRPRQPDSEQAMRKPPVRKKPDEVHAKGPR
jgi:predicted dehydrogenase